MPTTTWAVQNGVWPPRVLVTVTGLSIGDSVRIYRRANGVSTAIRGGYTASVGDTVFLAYDSELPFGIPVNYGALINGTTEASGTLATVALPGGKVAISDAITGNSAEVTVMAWDKTSYSADATVYRVSGKNKVVTGPGGLAGQFTADVRVRVESISAKTNLLNMLASATSGTLQIRRSVSNGTLDECYFSITAFDVERVSNRISDERRDIVMTIVEKDAWPSSFVTQGYTYGDLETLYSGLTYADLAADFPTYLDLMQADLS